VGRGHVAAQHCRRDAGLGERDPARHRGHSHETGDGAARHPPGQRIDKHVAALRGIRSRAYHLLNQLKDEPRSQNRVGALKLLLETEQEEARLDGSSLPHAVSARVAAAFQETVIQVLLEEGGPTLVRRVAERLRERIRFGDPGAALLGGMTQQAEQATTVTITIEADADPDTTDEEPS
jgi:hypothetical protein